MVKAALRGLLQRHVRTFNERLREDFVLASIEAEAAAQFGAMSVQTGAAFSTHIASGMHAQIALRKQLRRLDHLYQFYFLNPRAFEDDSLESISPKQLHQFYSELEEQGFMEPEEITQDGELVFGQPEDEDTF